MLRLLWVLRFFFGAGQERTALPCISSQFGVGKRSEPPSFGVGKRSEPPSFGVGKRSEPPSFGV